MAGLDWLQLREMDDEALERRLNLRHGRGAGHGHVVPDFAHVHQELKRNGVTLALLGKNIDRHRARRPTNIRAFAIATASMPKA